MDLYSLSELARGCWRSTKLITLLLWAGMQARRGASGDAAMQTEWRQSWAKRILRIMHVRVEQRGAVPQGGLLVSNHLGYLDVLVYGSVVEGTFLSKAEVGHWPLLGPLTRAIGTLYVERENARSTAAANRQIAAELERGRQVLVFPEGTSSGGEGVLKFQSPFFDAPQRAGKPVWTAAVAYRADLSHGTVAERICYWGDMVIGPHLFGLLCVKTIRATVVFSDTALTVTDRRTAAVEAHDAVGRLYADARRAD